MQKSEELSIILESWILISDRAKNLYLNNPHFESGRMYGSFATLFHVIVVLQFPWGLCIDTNATFFVAERDTERVKKINCCM